METNTRIVQRVQCWHHNVIILECWEPCTASERYAFHHAVTMWTPAEPMTRLELLDDNENGRDYYVQEIR